MIRKILRETWADWRHSWRTIMPLAILYRLLATMVFIPFFGFLINLIIAGASPLNLFNELVFQRFLLYSPILIFVIFGFFITVFVEQYCWMMLSYQNHRGGKFNLQQALKTFWQDFSKLWPVVMIQTSLNFLVAFFAGSLLATSPLVARFQFPTFISDFIEGQTVLVIIYVLVVILLVWIYMRTLFLASTAIATRAPFTHVYRETAKMMKRAMIRKLFFFVIAQAIVAITGVLILVAGFIVIVSVIQFIPGLNSLQQLMLVNVILVLLTTLGTIVWTPMQAFVIQNFYDVSQTEPGAPYPFTTARKSNPIIGWSVVAIVSVIWLGGVIATDLTRAAQPIAIAHRGSGFAPQNTVSAMELAIGEGALMLELDIQLTRDGVIILEHDKTYSRAYGIETLVSEMTYDEVKDLDAGAYFYGESTSETIATLEEIIVLTQATAMPLIIELKTYGSDATALIESLNELILAYECQNRCLVASANYKELEAIEAFNPDIFTLYVAYLALGDFASLDVDGFMIENTNLTKTAVQRIKVKQKVIYAWTVNTEAEVLSAWEKGVDGIITDDVPLLLKTYEAESN